MDPFEFARIATGMLPREDETGSNEESAQRGIPQKVSGIAEADSAGGYVSIDLGGSSVTEGDLQAVEMPTDIPVKAGDEVSVEIVDGKPRVVGRIGWGDELQGVADEALAVAQATGQYFWHDDAGAHVSTEALEPEGASNSLWNSLGLLIRKAANYLVSITQSAIAFYDGLGNAASNIVASFGSSGFQVGKASESHLEGDYHSLQMVDKEGSPYFNVSDLRDTSGVVSVTEAFECNGSYTRFNLSVPATSTSYTVKRNGSTVTSGITKTTEYFTLSSAPAAGTSLTATYSTSTQLAKAYTFGIRGSGTVGLMSVAEGSGTVASAMYAHAEGMGSTASEKWAHAEGQSTTASGWSAHAEGVNSAASGSFSHAEGASSAASGTCSHAEGNDAVASGAYSHAQNRGTTAASNYQTAIGKYNIADSSNEYALIIGNGTGIGSRSNAMTVDWDGAAAGLTFNGFRGRANLASTDDIDALYTTGIYYVGSNGVGGTLPSGVTTYFSLIAMGGSSETSTGYVGKQILATGLTLYVRSYAGSPRAWSAWEQLAYTPVPVDKGGTGASTASPNRVFAGPSSGTTAAAPSFRALVAADVPSLAASKITSGTLALARGGTASDNTARAINTVFAGPSSGSAGNASWRKLVAADIPNHSTSKLTSGTLGIARGGTGSSQVVSILNSSTWTILAWGPLVMVQCHGATAAADNTTMLNGKLASYKPAYNVSTIVADASANNHVARMYVEASTGSVKLASVGYTTSAAWYGTLTYIYMPA